MKKSCGFTLIEVVVALAILAIGIVALLGAQRAALAHRQMGWERHLATALAEEKLNEATTLPGTFPKKGYKEIQGIVLNWETQKKQIRPHFFEWNVRVQWGKDKTVQLSTWSRDKSFKNESE